MRHRKPAVEKLLKVAVGAPKFNVPTLQAMANDIASGKIKFKPKQNRLTVHDQMQPGLKADVFAGYWSYLVEYRVKGQEAHKRPHITIGQSTNMSISEARELAKVIRHLGSIGIDVKESLMDRLLAELKRDGIKWRGGMAPKP